MKRIRFSFWISSLVFGLLLITNSGMSINSQPITIKTWTYPDGYDPHGVYLDQVTFIVYPRYDEDLGLQALQACLIDAWDESVPIDNVEELNAAWGLEVRSESGDSYTMFCMNCERFPTNITGYRRALAYALDKYAVIQAAAQGFGYPQDCALPIALGNWTYESQLAETYYAQDITKANASLETAGFRDLNGDGWRDYDVNNNSVWDSGIDLNCSDFEIGLTYPTYSSSSDNVTSLAVEGLDKCGIRARVDPWDGWQFLWDSPLETGDYWVFCLTFSDMVSAERLFKLFHSSTPLSQWYFNGWNNSTFDQYAENMRLAQTVEEVQYWAWKCQEILWYEQPMIVCFNKAVTHAYRTDRWEGYINMQVRNRIGNGYSLVHIRLKESAGGPWRDYPLTTDYRMSLQDGLDTTNWLMSASSYTATVFQLVYEGLWTVSPYDWTPQLSLAYAWNIEATVASGDIQDGEKYTFYLYENATWHDGMPVTATDVAFSLSLGRLDPFNAEHYENVYMTNIINSKTIEFYTNNTGYFEWVRSTGFTVYPAHIWSDPENVTSWEPSVSELVGSGPYRFTDHVPGQYVVLDRNHEWRFAVEMPFRSRLYVEQFFHRLIFYICVIVIVIHVILLGILIDKDRLKARSKADK